MSDTAARLGRKLLLTALAVVVVLLAVRVVVGAVVGFATTLLLGLVVVGLVLAALRFGRRRA